MLAVALQRQRRSGHRLDGAERIALDAGHLNEARNRIAGHAEMMFERDFRSILSPVRVSPP